MPDLPESTLVGLEGRRGDVVGLWGRRAFIALLAAVVLVGLSGYLGVHSTERSASEGEWSLELRYAGVARAGLDVPWTATVTRQGGFGQEVTLAVTGTYFDIYETQGFNPVPSKTTRDGEIFYLTFDAPPRGEVFVVTYDAYIQPAAQQGKSGSISVVDNGVEVATVDFQTRVFP